MGVGARDDVHKDDHAWTIRHCRDCSSHHWWSFFPTGVGTCQTSQKDLRKVWYRISGSAEQNARYLSAENCLRHAAGVFARALVFCVYAHELMRVRVHVCTCARVATKSPHQSFYKVFVCVCVWNRWGRERERGVCVCFCVHSTVPKKSFSCWKCCFELLTDFTFRFWRECHPYDS